MALKDKIRTMGLMPKLPDIGEIQRMMDARFGQLDQRLTEIRDILTQIRDKAGPT